MVNIYDLKNKILCGTSKKYHLPMSDRVLFAMSDGGVVYLLTTSGQIVRFREKDTHRKLDVLLTQSSPPLYSLAIVLAAEEQLEPAEIMKLYKVSVFYRCALSVYFSSFTAPRLRGDGPHVCVCVSMGRHSGCVAFTSAVATVPVLTTRLC
jgi:hypothetical protein